MNDNVFKVFARVMRIHYARKKAAAELPVYRRLLQEILREESQ